MLRVSNLVSSNMDIININNKNSLNEAAEILKANGILVFPTDTVYGIGCALNEKAIKKLYKIKNRPQNKPTAILMTEKYYDHKIADYFKKYKKGQATLVLNKKLLDFDIPSIITKDNKIGIRNPNLKWLEDLIDLTGPIVASSANRQGEPTPSNFKNLDSIIIDEADLVIKSHIELNGTPSMVFDIEENKIIRP
ncbi:MAG: Translation factor SUA5 [Berkelbacteria bacterium GW2011_GWB1_38_5]|uniref:L-threonylcarbamoyladenylate synthase n=2 Tax=Candidatus Berkelbacteria TaxID=1618330 RepID=A0A0G0LI23_9BACT|nr:MAG: Translation factor SUA5 [Berkelbacteria bacterium GW2011_GWB1_38_5]KKQ90702.1 MAG: Translation factor SUA5 [Berkelbacteria bacterium GW2011_GWA1_39_10]